MPWMTEWAGPHPVFVEHASGAHFMDVDGNNYVDFCLGDTGAMTGHGPPAVVMALSEQATKGITHMLPTEDALWVGEELTRRFGLPYWQFCLTATDANRFTIRLAREISGRPKVLVYNWCYHGSVDESLITREESGVTRPRLGNIGPPIDPAITTRIVEWNDVDELERALANRDVACVLAEPALTNIGIVLPLSGYHDALRHLTQTYGTYLVIDETHTLCAGPGGYTRAHALQPDFITAGKSLASGVPAAVYGMSSEVAHHILERRSILRTSDTGGIGGTLSGNALSLAAMRATLQHVFTDDAFDSMVKLAVRFEDGTNEMIRGAMLPWHVVRLGCRVEYRFIPEPPINGAQAAAANDPELETYMHLYALNRGVLMTPFHNMALMCPSTVPDDVDRHTNVFGQAVKALTSLERE